MIIKFDTIPANVEVYLDHEYVGRTPIDVTDVEDGVHSYTLKKDKDNQFDGKLLTQQEKITHIEMDFNKNSKTEKYIDIVSAQEQCSSPSVYLSIPENHTCSSPNINMTISEEQSCPSPNIDMIIPEEQPTTSPTEQPAQAPSEQPPTEQPTQQPTEQPPQPPAGAPEQIPSASLDDVLGEIQRTNDTLETILQNIEESKKPRITTIYDNEAIIQTSVPSNPNDTVSPLYQQEKIYDIIGHNAEFIHIYNYGPGLLYVVSSTNVADFTKETLILEGEQKNYTNIHTLGLRSPTALLKYRVTERPILNQASQQFTGSRYKERRDRRGVVIYEDDYESPTTKFLPSFIGAGTATRSTDTAYAGDFSLKLVTGAVFGDISEVQYNHPDFHASKLGVQVRFATAISQSVVGIGIHHIMTNGFAHIGDINITMAGVLRVFEADGNFHDFQSGFQIETALTGWNTLKLVIDLGTNKYVNATLNGVTVDLSSIDLNLTSNVSPTEFIINFLTLQFTGGGVSTCYYDNYIFTEDEVITN